MFARTWSEELIAEWLMMKGYVVLIGVPAGSGGRGGRKEADVIGFRVRGDFIEVIHFEISSVYLKGDEVVEYVLRKFSNDRVNYLRKYIEERMNGLKVRRYVKSVLLFTSKKSLNYSKSKLKAYGINVYDLKELYEEEIRPTINDQVKKGRAFPDSCWLLKMLWFFKSAGIVL